MGIKVQKPAGHCSPYRRLQQRQLSPHHALCRLANCACLHGEKKRDIKEIKQFFVSIISHSRTCLSPLPAGDCNIYKATGGNVTLKLHVKRADGQIITWSHDSKTYVEVKNNKERCCDGSMKDMLSDGSLHLTGLTKAKGGKYQSTVYGNDGKPVVDPKTYTLCVLGR